jgi:hypothetical protein
MSGVVCPRCGARDSFKKGYLPETCLCLVCQSQLDYREIPGCGPDCGSVDKEPPTGDKKSPETEAADGGTND